MKKFLIGLCLSSVLLAGCHQDKSSYVAKEDKIAISTTDFKDEDAQKLVESVLKKQFPQYECTVTQTIIKGNNVYGIYTYQKNGRTMTQQVSLSIQFPSIRMTMMILSTYRVLLELLIIVSHR